MEGSRYAKVITKEEPCWCRPDFIDFECLEEMLKDFDIENNFRCIWCYYMFEEEKGVCTCGQFENNEYVLHILTNPDSVHALYELFNKFHCYTRINFISFHRCLAEQVNIHLDNVREILQAKVKPSE